MSVNLRTATATDVGKVRSNNEDCAHAGRRLIALADGIGGAPSGELASDLAIRTIAELDARQFSDGASAVAALTAAVGAANRRIRDKSDSDVAHDGMGTTLTAVILAGAELALIHVGDSRCYLMHAGALSQLTRDDTFVQSLLDEGLITAEQARVHPRRSLVTQALQGYEYIATTAVLPARAGDRLLLCSDGLSDVATDDEIATAMRTFTDPGRCAKALIKLALAGGAPDNVTVVLADVVA